ncbi:MAG: DUF2950 domain-containing protein [Steroidobacteraceae bacterium]|jgi:hypothetical protein|nr:DUF2950 domain-containing protein [Steroidobacteraceae bacterium]
MNKMTRLSASWLMLVGIAVLAAACGKEPRQQSFDSPEQAIEAMTALIGQQDERAVDKVFGPGAYDLFRSGDEAADREDFERVKAMVGEGVDFAEFDDKTVVALLGEDGWPWPIPLVQQAGKWRFDTAAGREELLNRRIGRNELYTLTALHAFVDAQREYASEGRDGNPRAFAQKFRSSPGKRDGLYWEPVEGEPLSPLGDLLAGTDRSSDTPEPFHGYYYRILVAQGPGAVGGEKSYLDDKGLLTGGFAAVAWPAKHGNSGVMTFIVNHRGLVYQKDFGAGTDKAVEAIQAFDPDASWELTPDELEAVAD